MFQKEHCFKWHPWKVNGLLYTKAPKVEILSTDSGVHHSLEVEKHTVPIAEAFVLF